jgi:hypothetical protein
VIPGDTSVRSKTAKDGHRTYTLTYKVEGLTSYAEAKDLINRLDEMLLEESGQETLK